MLQVRHVVGADQARLRDIRLSALASDPDAFSSTYERDAGRDVGWWERWAAESQAGSTQRTFVLVGEEDRWLGLALVRIADDRPRVALLHGMWVTPEARGRGGAHLLCDACAAWAAEKGCQELTLRVMADNPAARRVYARAGFAAGEETAGELAMARRL